MKITIIEKDGMVIVEDSNGNKVYCVKKTNYLKILFASFNNVTYDKLPLDWKRSGRGAVSKAFYDWYEEIDNLIYKKHYLGLSV